jgi:hypothetical protein
MGDKSDNASRTAWVSIAVAVLGLFGTAVVALIQWRADRELEQTRLNAQLELAEQQFRSKLILRALEPESERDRRDLLTFLHRAGLVEGLGQVLESYSEKDGSFVPRSSGGVSFNEVSTLLNQQTANAEPRQAPVVTPILNGLRLSSLAQRFLAVAGPGEDGRNPTADQRVAEAIRLAVEGPPGAIERARQLLAEAGYPRGFSLSLSLEMFARVAGTPEQAERVAASLRQIGVGLALRD